MHKLLLCCMQYELHECSISCVERRCWRSIPTAYSLVPGSARFDRRPCAWHTVFGTDEKRTQPILRLAGLGCNSHGTQAVKYTCRHRDALLWGQVDYVIRFAGRSFAARRSVQKPDATTGKNLCPKTTGQKAFFLHQDKPTLPHRARRCAGMLARMEECQDARKKTKQRQVYHGVATRTLREF